MWRYKDVVLCANSEYADAWFPEERKRQEAEYVKRAKYSTDICKQCPVQAECLAWAIQMSTDDQHGTLGGLTWAARSEARLGKRTYHGQRAEDQDAVRELLNRKATT